MQGLWRLVTGVELKPVGTAAIPASATSSAVPAVPVDADKLDKWEIKAEKAAGAIRSTISPDLKVHIRDCEDDPVKIWETLKAAFIQQRTAPRFNAYHTLLSIQKGQDESLDAVINRVDQQIRVIKSLSPQSFTLDDLYDELATMAIIRSLPQDFDHVIRTISILDVFDKQKVISGLRNMEDNRQNIMGTVLSTTSSSSSSSSLPNRSKNRPKCNFCDRLGHLEAKCFLKEKLAKNMKEQGARPAQSDVPTAPQSASISSASSLYSSRPQHHSYALWNADTGASSHMTFHRHWLRNYRPHRIQIKLADGSVIYSEGIGSVQFEPVIEGKVAQIVEFSNVLYVPSLRNNLLSVLYLTMNRRFHVHTVKDTMTFELNDRVRFVAKVDPSYNSAFLQGCTIPLEEYVNLSSSTTLPLDLSLWHRRLCHHHLDGVKKLIREDLVVGMKLSSSTAPDPICEPCLAGKMTADPFPSSSNRATEPLQLVHSDVHGPVKVQTVSGYRYWIAFLDDYTRHRAVILLKRKSDTFAALKQYKAWAERRTGKKLLCLRDDKGGEYMSSEFNQYCIDNGIERQHTVRNRPQQNGVAERANRTMEEGVVAMLYEAGLPLSFWGEALSSFIHVWNMVSTSALSGMTPHEAFYGRKPNVSRLRVWGCVAYVLIQKDKRPYGSLGPHMEKCIFIGYPEGYKGWKFYNPETKKAVVCERADFDERYFLGRRETTPSFSPPARLLNNEDPAPVPLPLPSPDSPSSDEDDDGNGHMQDYGGDDDESNPSSAPSAPSTPPPAVPALPPSTPPLTPRPGPSQARSSPHPRRQPSPEPLSPNTPPLALRRPARTRRPRDEWEPEQWTIRQPTPSIPSDSDSAPDSSDSDDPLLLQSSLSASQAEPRTYKQSQKRPDADQWTEAAEDELRAHAENGTWEIVKLPPGKKAIGSRWFMKIKHKADGSIERYRARLVAKGYSQRPGFDYVETFAPTVRFAAVRTVLAIAALEDLELRSVDISHAFLNGDLEEEIYMDQPEGFEVGGPEYVCRLKKSLYGLKQAGRVWNKKLHAALAKMGFIRIQSDNSVYVFLKDDVHIILPIFVDDITLACKSSTTLDSTVKELSSHFKLRDLGPISYLLGIKIERDRSKRQIHLSQTQYIIDMLERYGHSDCKPVSTPMDPGLRLSSSMAPQNDEEIALMKSIPYINAVGSLMYLAISSRPDIAYSVGVLARFNSNPGPLHWKAVKHLLRYLKGTMDIKLVYGPSDSSEPFITYTDADHGGNPDNGRSTGGYLVRIGTGAVSWSSKLQSLVALSTTEAEYVAAVEAGKEMVWLRQFLGELGYPQHAPSVLRMDNQSAISVAKNPEHHGRMKHLDLRWYWLRDVVDQGLIEPSFIPTDDMAADILTKPLLRLQVEKCRRLMGLVTE